MISSFIAANHTILFALGALLMLVFAALSVSGHMWAMPSFMRSPNLTKANYSGFFAFGIFSGIASSCCAPVLAGILTLSAISRSPIHAVAMGLAYVFGMVFPLLVIALCWDVFDLGRRSFTPKPLRLRVFGRSLHTNIINVFVALGFLIMAILIGIVAFTGEMPSSHQQPLWVVGTWIGSTLAPVAQLLAFIPALVQGLILLALAVVVIVVGTVLLPRLADHKHDIDASLAHMLADEHGSAATSMQHSAQHDEMSEEHHLRTSTGEIRNES
ncbi:cytochrome c biogenesis protein, transmembrane region [Bifidobacterium mongoliense]|uniref:Cytochrome c biogenesis protein, transmembrane region n=2 Tax=Bifidobacterium mongoliense TaxID=518643 RepID=A0A423UBZ5_9BIFI|nr:cytochrome c biogenesis protein, transmembrane region [Bifidobacterium mongoliense]